MVWDGLEPGASMWEDRSSVYFEKLTMASGWSRERVNMALPRGQRAGQSGDV